MKDKEYYLSAQDLTASEIQALYGIPLSTLRSWRHRGLLRPSFRIQGWDGAPAEYYYEKEVIQNIIFERRHELAEQLGWFDDLFTTPDEKILPEYPDEF